MMVTARWQLIGRITISPRPTRNGNLEGPDGPRGTFVICHATRLMLHQFAQLSQLVVRVTIVESQSNWTHI